MSQRLDELLAKIEAGLDHAKADPQAFLDDPRLMESLTDDSLEFGLLINDLNSRLSLLFVDYCVVAESLREKADAIGLVFDRQLLRLLAVIIGMSKGSKHV